MKKPDFEEAIGKLWKEANRFPMGAKAITRQIWNDYVEPLQKRLEEAEIKNRELQWEILKLSKLDEPIRGEEISALEKDRDEFAIGVLNAGLCGLRLKKNMKTFFELLNEAAFGTGESYEESIANTRRWHEDYKKIFQKAADMYAEQKGYAGDYATGGNLIGTGIPEGGKDYEGEKDSLKES